jgi:hypothetical protein
LVGTMGGHVKTKQECRLSTSFAVSNRRPSSATEQEGFIKE